MVVEAWAVGKTTGPLASGNEAARGLTELSNLDVIRPGCNPNDLLGDIFSSHCGSA